MFRPRRLMERIKWSTYGVEGPNLLKLKQPIFLLKVEMYFNGLSKSFFIGFFGSKMVFSWVEKQH